MRRWRLGSLGGRLLPGYFFPPLVSPVENDPQRTRGSQALEHGVYRTPAGKSLWQPSHEHKALSFRPEADRLLLTGCAAHGSLWSASSAASRSAGLRTASAFYRHLPVARSSCASATDCFRPDRDDRSTTASTVVVDLLNRLASEKAAAAVNMR
jgi:hypothetical protein